MRLQRDVDKERLIKCSLAGEQNFISSGPAPRYLTRFVPTSPDCEVKGAGNSQAATIRVSMRYVTMGCSPGRRRGQGFVGFHPPARDCQTRVPVAILALRLPTEVEEAA